ncbi:PEPxxWA-CTERM sorting domain-containing protein [Phenylobacterium sp.]|jgi:hypothetical protein|uniref:PEPxxWA-CTERM sorting domain-containing protein n=1 Tax=Phenylobacterium sp. TaxID=1871053 RepID=UPI002F3EA5C3
MRVWRFVFPGMMAAAVVGLSNSASAASPFFFSTGNPDGRIATASGGPGEPETGDDFVLANNTRLIGGSFTGILTGTAVPLSEITNISVEFYRVFPLDSTVPPSGAVPARANSPADVAFSEFSTAAHTLTASISIPATSFTVANTVVTGIHPLPGVFTGGEGPGTGEEVQFSFSFSVPQDLLAGQYFFVPQVELSDPVDNFLWLSAPKPIVAPGTPFNADLQTWIRNEALQPNWLRVGTDITHQGPFNAAFSLIGTVPEPSSWAMLIMGFGAMGAVLRRRRGAGQVA